MRHTSPGRASYFDLSETHERRLTENHFHLSLVGATGIGKTLRAICNTGRYRVPYERGLLDMIANRLCEPESKRGSGIDGFRGSICPLGPLPQVFARGTALNPEPRTRREITEALIFVISREWKNRKSERSYMRDSGGQQILPDVLRLLSDPLDGGTGQKPYLCLNPVPLSPHSFAFRVKMITWLSPRAPNQHCGHMRMGSDCLWVQAPS